MRLRQFPQVAGNWSWMPPKNLLASQSSKFRNGSGLLKSVSIGRAVREALGERRAHPPNENPKNIAEYSGIETRKIAAQRAGFGGRLLPRCNTDSESRRCSFG